MSKDRCKVLHHGRKTRRCLLDEGHTGRHWTPEMGEWGPKMIAPYHGAPVEPAPGDKRDHEGYGG